MKSIPRNELVSFCEKYLKVKDFQDHCRNGLHVEGKPNIERIVTGVSLSEKLIKEAIRRKADMLIVHHGIFPGNIPQPPIFRGALRKRLKLLLEHELNLCGFHLPLDAHPIIGNNISLCRLLGVQACKPWKVGFIGRLKRPIAFAQFQKQVNLKLGTKSYAISAGPKLTSCVAIISGGASSEYAGVFERGADTYLCGDISEGLVRVIEETGINFINAGHYNTEKLGVINLGKLLVRKFKVQAEFVDIPCEI